MDLFIGILIAFVVSAIINIWFLVLFFMFLKFTPSWSWLKAWILKRPLFFLYFKDNTYAIKVGGKREGNFSTIKGLGPFEMQQGTGSMEQKTRVISYSVITENSKTISLWRAAIVKELQLLGLEITKWDDINKIIQSASDDNWVRKTYADSKAINPENAEKFKRFVNYIRKADVSVFFNRPYRIAELYNMFSDDFNPVVVEEARYMAVQKDRKNRDSNMMPWVIAIFILLLGAAIAYVVIKGAQNPNITVTLAQAVKDNATVLLA
jgi:hypothetical protein